jgi:hypothetical protein
VDQAKGLREEGEIMMHGLLKEIPELQEGERTMVSTWEDEYGGTRRILRNLSQKGVAA